MTQELAVRSLSEYLDLPVVETPLVAGGDESGMTYLIHQLGWFRAERGEYLPHAARLMATYDPDIGGYLLPVALVERGGRKKLFRLPCSLAGWVLSCTNVAGPSARRFPARVEFGIRDDRCFAEISQRSSTVHSVGAGSR